MAALFAPTPTRPLVIHSPSARITIPVPSSPLPAWVTSEVLAQDFHDARVGLDEEPQPVEEDEDGNPIAPNSEPQAKLLARFLSYVADKQASSPSAELAQVLVAAYDRFNDLFLSLVNVHSLVQSYESEARTEILTAYYKAFTIARDALGPNKVKVAHSSALVEATRKGEAELYALFGGQGVNEVSLHRILGGLSPLTLSFSIISTSYNTCMTSTDHLWKPSSPRSPPMYSCLWPKRQTSRGMPTTSMVST